MSVSPPCVTRKRSGSHQVIVLVQDVAHGRLRRLYFKSALGTFSLKTGVLRLPALAERLHDDRTWPLRHQVHDAKTAGDTIRFVGAQGGLQSRTRRPSQ